MYTYVLIGIMFISLIAILVYYYNNKSYIVVPEPKGLIKLKTNLEMFGGENHNGGTKEVIFEPVDIEYYKDQPRMLLDYIDFDLENEIVDIPQVDLQNVHDTNVQKSIRKIFSDVDIVNDSVNIKQSIKEILKKADGNPNVIDVINKIKERNSNIININNKTELEVLASVWEKVKDDPNKVDFFITNLSDSKENESVVCPSGVVTRIISTLALDDISKFPKTQENLNDEMMTTASKVRKTLEKENNYTEEYFKEVLIDKYQDDYAGILSLDEIKDKCKDWINVL